jgi:hypothetical protein
MNAANGADSSTCGLWCQAFYLRLPLFTGSGLEPATREIMRKPAFMTAIYVILSMYAVALCDIVRLILAALYQINYYRDHLGISRQSILIRYC